MGITRIPKGPHIMEPTREKGPMVRELQEIIGGPDFYTEVLPGILIELKVTIDNFDERGYPKGTYEMLVKYYECFRNAEFLKETGCEEFFRIGKKLEALKLVSSGYESVLSSNS